jgi:hypothetical protein
MAQITFSGPTGDILAQDDAPESFANRGEAYEFMLEKARQYGLLTKRDYRIDWVILGDNSQHVGAI